MLQPKMTFQKCIATISTYIKNLNDSKFIEAYLHENVS